MPTGDHLPIHIETVQRAQADLPAITIASLRDLVAVQAPSPDQTRQKLGCVSSAGPCRPILPTTLLRGFWRVDTKQTMCLPIEDERIAIDNTHLGNVTATVRREVMRICGRQRRL